MLREPRRLFLPPGEQIASYLHAIGDALRPASAAFMTDLAAHAATMGRIQSGAILAATGLGDADAYDELATLLLDGIGNGFAYLPE